MELLINTSNSKHSHYRKHFTNAISKEKKNQCFKPMDLESKPMALQR